ncbi:hypothetical protein CBL_20163 [Carabus blaptoides fortunei]
MEEYKNNAKKEEKWKELSLLLQKDEDDEEEDKEDDGLDFLNECTTQRSTITNINVPCGNNDIDFEECNILLSKRVHANNIDTEKLENNLNIETNQEDTHFASEDQDDTYFECEQISMDVEVDSAVLSNNTAKSSIPAPSLPSCSSSMVGVRRRKHTKEPMGDYISVMRDKNAVLKEIVRSSTDLTTVLGNAQCKKEKSVMEKYFDAFSAEIAELPHTLQAKCQRELQLSAMAIIHKYQDLAEQKN